MPLSEHEQRLLDEMERNLYQNDADFVAAVSQGPKGRPAYRAVVIGVLVAVIGVVALIAGVFVQLTVVGIVGFALMFAGVLLAITPSRNRGGLPGDDAGRTPRGSSSAQAAPGAGFMDRLNERWDKRDGGEQ